MAEREDRRAAQPAAEMASTGELSGASPYSVTAVLVEPQPGPGHPAPGGLDRHRALVSTLVRTEDAVLSRYSVGAVLVLSATVDHAATEALAHRLSLCTGVLTGTAMSPDDGRELDDLVKRACRRAQIHSVRNPPTTGVSEP